VKCRLAGRLGIGLPQTGRQIPTMTKSPSSAGSVESRTMSSDVGTTGLSIMGNRDDLDPFRSAVYCFVVNFVCSTLLVFFGCTAVPGIRCGLLLPLYCAICVCLLATRMSHANTTEPIEMPFGMSLGETMYWVCAWISPQERALVGLPRLASGQFFQACLLSVQEQCGLWITCLL